MIAFTVQPFSTMIDFIQTHWLELFVVITGLMLVINLTRSVFEWFHNWLTDYPETQFGFKGILIYVDDSPNSKVFINHKYELCAKPDFIFRIGYKKYVIVEFKSRKAPVRPSDIAQLKATALSARSQFNVVCGYVVTGSEIQEIVLGSNASVYRDIKAAHKKAKSIKRLGQCPKVRMSDKCKTCGYFANCGTN